MRNVLMVAHDFPPRGATGVIRVTKFVRYLPDFGWRPVAVTAAGHGWVQDEGLLAELPPDLEVISVAHPLAKVLRRSNKGREGAQPHVSRSSASGLRQCVRRLLIPDPQILWTPAAVRAASARLRRGDIAALWSTSPPQAVQLAGLWLKRRFPRLPWVMDLRDIWSDSPTIHDPLLYKLNRSMEGACLRGADRVVVVTEAMRSLLARQHDLPVSKFATITNGFDPLDFPLASTSQRTDALQLTYVGTMVGTRAPAARGLFEALARLMERGIGPDALRVRLVGSFDAHVHAWAGPLIEAGLVTLTPFQTHSEAVATMASADVLLLMMTGDWEGKIAVPNKLYEYFATGKHVLALAPEGEIARLVRMYGGGTVVGPFEVERIVDAVLALIERHRAGELQPLPPNDQRLRRFQRRDLTRQLAAVLDEVAA